MKLCCPYCQKQYKRKKALDKHKLICCLNTHNFSYDEIIPTQKEMWLMIQRLVKTTEEQEKKIKKLENIIDRDVKKVDVIEWLNENESCEIDFKLWIKSHIIITMEDIKTIFVTDFMRGLNNIITNNIIDKEIPLKAFTHKTRQLYLYESKNNP